MVTTSLRERLRQAIHIRNMSDRTEEINIQCVARFAQHFHRSPDRLGRGEIEQYLLFLRDVKRVSWAWVNQIVCALRFFYLYVLDRPDLVRVGAASSNSTLSRILIVVGIARFATAPDPRQPRSSRRWMR